MKKLLLLIVLSSFYILKAQTQISLIPFSSGLDLPVSITHAQDSRLFIVERHGRIMIADSSGQLLPTPFLDIQNQVRSTAGEQGLLGLVFDPEYAQNGRFYVNYTFGDGRTNITRFERDALNPNLADPASEQILLQVAQPFSNHNAGDLAFGPDSMLYVTLGDGGSGGDPGNRAQNRKTYLGKILRLDVSGDSGYAIPPDNPFVGDTAAFDEIWSYGWRNPWRLSFDRLNGDMWVGDVGQNKFEEISLEVSGTAGGQNYGWRCIEGNSPFNGTGCGPVNLFTPPVYSYPHPVNGDGSVTGGYVYRGSLHTAMEGHYLFGDYETGEFWMLVNIGGGAYSLLPQGQLLGSRQISAFGEDASGELYVAAYNEGKVYQIVENSTSIEPGQDPFGIELYPNPTQKQLFVRFQNPPAKAYEIHIYKLNGQKVHSFQGSLDPAGQKLEFDLDAGVYLLEIAGERSAYKKLVIR